MSETEAGRDVVDVFVEIPKGSRNKYEWDFETGRFTLDRMLFSAVHYPGDYGFVPHTWAEDGDPLDAVVLLSEPTFPGCVIAVRVIGVFFMRDEKGPDAKVIGVPDSDPHWEQVADLADAPSHLLDEVGHFFSIYKDLEAKTVTVDGFAPREQARVEIARARAAYATPEHKPPMP
jgi:inorganic pyrophosphatase